MFESARRFAETSKAVWRGIGRVDRPRAEARVAALKKRYPKLSLVERERQLILAKCMAVGAVAGVTGASAALPVAGAFAPLVLGPLADRSVLTMLQAELVVELFALHKVTLPPDAERLALVALAGSKSGAEHAGLASARLVAVALEKALGRSWTKRAVPLAAALTGALSQIALTYAIGTRTAAIAKLPQARAADWSALLGRVIEVDERGMTAWTARAAKETLAAANRLAGLVLGEVADVARRLERDAAARFAAPAAAALSTRRPRVVAKRPPAKKSASVSAARRANARA